MLQESTISNKIRIQTLLSPAEMHEFDKLNWKNKNNITCSASTVTNLVEENVLIIYVHDTIL